MTTTFHITLPVSALVYDRDEVLDWQEDRDYATDHQPEAIGSNRFHLGYTAFFEDFGNLRMDFEPSKALLPEIYDWLMQHAPNAVVEVGEYELEYDSEAYANDENFSPELSDGDEEPSSGAAEVYLNFGQDHTHAVDFKVRFGLPLGAAQEPPKDNLSDTEHCMLYTAQAGDLSRPAAENHISCLSREICPGARFIFCDAPLLSELTYLAVRPTFEFGDHTVGSTLADAEEYHLQLGEPARPSYAGALYDSMIDIVDDMLSIRGMHPHLKLWYNGQEVQAPFSDWLSFAVMLSEGDETWEIVALVADGCLAVTDPLVLDAALKNPLIGTAVARVTV